MTMKFSTFFWGLLLALISITNAKAQDSTKPSFTVTQTRLNDSIVQVHVQAKLPKGLRLISTKPNGLANTSLNFDSSLNTRSRDLLEIVGKPKFAKFSASDTTEIEYFEDSVSLTQNFAISKTETMVCKLKPLAYTWNGKEDINPVQEDLRVSIPLGGDKKVDTNSGSTEIKSPWGLLLVGLLIGLAAVFTPCVFPLLPMTASFFTKRSKTKAEGIRNAWIYALSIIFICVVPALLLTAFSGDKTIIYRISTSTIANLLFFIIFLVFAISFFGAFEITAPSSWTNNTDAKASKGGFAGIFFMALTMVLVSFSCTLPFISAMLATTVQSGITLAPIAGMLGFGIGFAVPFALMATFPTLLNQLPKSGGWLNAVKVSFGFIELALALKFLSNVDQAYHWRLLDRDIFLVLWIVLFGLLGLYLLGKLKFSHDSDLPHIGIPRLFLAITSLSFALYMIPGLFGAPLQAISGILPNPNTQEFNLHEGLIELKNKRTENASGSNAPMKYTNLFKAPYGLNAYFDYTEGIAAAKALHKPVMIDFTGHSCANCRKMEVGVWVDPQILQRLNNDFVLIQLYVDDKTELPENEWYTNKEGVKINTIGGRNLDLESSRFNEVSQPFYVFLDNNETLLGKGVGYGDVGSVELFGKHLDAMKAAFGK
jgi:thiol:disulfide interchange protein